MTQRPVRLGKTKHAPTSASKHDSSADLSAVEDEVVAGPKGVGSRTMPVNRCQPDTKNAIAFGKLVVANTRQQQEIIELQGKLGAATADLQMSRETIQKLTLDVAHLTQALAATESDMNELQRGNHKLRERYEDLQIEQTSAIQAASSEKQLLERRLTERSMFANYLFKTTHRMLADTANAISEEFMFRDALFRGMTKDLVVHSIRDTQTRMETEHSASLTLILERHRQELDLKEEGHKAELAQQEATHQLQLQSLETQIGELERRLHDQKVMIDQQRHQEAVLRGILPPDQQEPQIENRRSRSRSPAGALTNNIEVQPPVISQVTRRSKSPTTTSVNTSLTSNGGNGGTYVQAFSAGIGSIDESSALAKDARSATQSSRLADDAQIKDTLRRAQQIIAQAQPQQQVIPSEEVPLGSEGGGRAHDTWGVREGYEELQRRAEHHESLEEPERDHRGIGGPLPTAVVGAPAVSVPINAMDEVDRGLAACLRSLSQCARR